MKNREIAYIGIRILSLYIFIQAGISLVNFANMSIIPVIQQDNVLGYDFFQVFIIFFVPFVILLGFGLLLWIFTDRISQFMIIRKSDIRDEPNSVTEEIKDGGNQLTIQSLQAVVFSIIGLIIITKAIPDLVRLFSNIKLMMGEKAYINEEIRSQYIFGYLAIVVKLVIGFGLFVGGKGLVGIFKKIRNWGLSEEE